MQASFFSLVRKPAYAIAAPSEKHAVRDSLTHNVIMRGTRAECLSYINAYGQCYLAGES